MDSLAKTCPRCNAKLRQGDGAYELVKKKGGAGAESLSQAGLSVVPYHCPKCGYIELYDLKVVSRL